MKPSTIPMTCSLALATLSGAVLSHWWSLREFGIPLASLPRWAAPHSPAIIPDTPAIPDIPAIPAPLVAQPAPVAEANVLASQPAPAPAADPSAAQKEFYESLIDEMKQLKQTNMALRDQMAETNRDLMKLEFRVDTHSASFRPLPVTEELSTLDSTSIGASSLDSSSLDTSTQGAAFPDAGPGVLPPRAVRVDLPN
jgi:hypothetical protein